MADKLDILSNLLELTWRDISVPCQANDVSFSHNLVEHNQYGVAGGEQENTCRKSARFSFRVPFRVGIAGYQNLYPGLMRQFWTACLDPTTGPFLHPELGYFDCKVAEVKVHYDPRQRDGADLDVTWVETIELGESLETGTVSPITYATTLAVDLESTGPAVNLPPYDDGSGMSLLDAMKKLKGAMMLAELSAQSILGDVQNALEAVNGLIDFASSRSNPAASPVVKSLKGIATALMQIEEQAGLNVQAKRKVEIKYTTAEQSATLVATSFGVSVEDLFKANPMLATLDPVPAGTMVFVVSKA